MYVPGNVLPASVSLASVVTELSGVANSINNLSTFGSEEESGTFLKVSFVGSLNVCRAWRARSTPPVTISAIINPIKTAIVASFLTFILCVVYRIAT